MQIQLWREDLLDQQLTKKWLDSKSLEAYSSLHEVQIPALKEWLSALSKTAVTKETTLEQRFNQLIFEDLLGYKLQPSEDASAWPKPSTIVTGIPTEPDLILGEFGKGKDRRIAAVVELKKPGTDLDAPQARTPPKSPVEQAFDCGLGILGVRWVIVSDMRCIRLYSVEQTAAYEEFDLQSCIDRFGNVNESAFKRLYFLLHRDFLVGTEGESATSKLLKKSLEYQLSIGESFYSIYYQIRIDLIHEIEVALEQIGMSVTRLDILSASQRLLDRLIFLCFCEDAPDPLIPPDTIKRITTSARTVSGLNVYDSLKTLFREVDAGSPPDSIIKLFGYNGELFKPHPILDVIQLPNSLHDKVYSAPTPDGGTIRVKGAWGLHEFNFWSQLNERLLGQIFEESLSDTKELEAGTLTPLSVKLTERKRHGIYYTNKILSDYLVKSALEHTLSDFGAKATDLSEQELRQQLEQRLERLSNLKVIDLACGSGAFLVSAYDTLLRELLKTWNGLQRLGKQDLPILAEIDVRDRASVLRGALHGIDLLPQAAEIAKLSLWLKSAQKSEKISNLQENIVGGDTLKLLTQHHPLLQRKYDLVVGNPPWGSEIEHEARRRVAIEMKLDSNIAWDSWELFTILSIQSLQEGGRLALVLPDSLFAPEKSRIREYLLKNMVIEKMLNLGPNWFGTNVKMSTVLLQARKGQALQNSFDALILSGELRKDALAGKIPLKQIESRISKAIPQERSLHNSRFEIELFRGSSDEVIFTKLTAQDHTFGSLMISNRGEELSTSGHLWRCNSCLRLVKPGRKEKGGTLKDKPCDLCGNLLKEREVRSEHLVSDTPSNQYPSMPFIDGNDLGSRYAKIQASKFIALNPDWTFKPKSLYEGPKMLIREAGVGLAATLDLTDSYCPRTLFIYKLKPDELAKGYAYEYLLAVLLSRTAAYYILKKSGEIDTAKAHAKITHEELEALPVPIIDFSDKRQAMIHREIVEAVRRIRERDTPELGGKDDLLIEQHLRTLWGITPEEGAYINSEFSTVPKGQMVNDLFPHGVPLAAKTALVNS
jgi:tRNA1(Val) A37 N6-methylase TrmN6